MSIDLTLLPFDCDQPTISYSHTMLSCGSRRTLLLKIEQLISFDAPDDFTCYLAKGQGGDCSSYGVVTQCKYGKRLQYVTAKQLCSLATIGDVQESAKNRAIWAYLAALPPKTKVALYWS